MNNKKTLWLVGIIAVLTIVIIVIGNYWTDEMSSKIAELLYTNLNLG